AGKTSNDANSFAYKYLKDRIYKEDEFYFRAGNYFFRKYKPAFFYFYHNGTDPIAHYFLKCFEAENSDNLSEADKSTIETMERYYDYVDSRISEFLKVQEDKRIFVFLSDHGMVKTPWLIRQYRNRIVKNPYLYGYHDDPIKGFFMIAGTSIKPDNHIDAPSVYNITPTVLYLMGYPTAKDMDVGIVKSAIDEDFLSKFEVETIKTYDHLNRVRPIEHKETISDEEAIKKLKSLGYI
ncbi:alkaline phosphatase family protein, partial [bacterium]|nr:alkaline phosphatase family protein [bacterium]